MSSRFNRHDHQSHSANTVGGDPAYAGQGTDFQLHRQWQGDPRNTHQQHHSYAHGETDLSNLVLLLQRIFQNKTLLVLIGVLLIVALGLTVTAMLYAVPSLGKLLGFVDISNWQGLVDQGILMLQKILIGAKSA